MAEDGVLRISVKGAVYDLALDDFNGLEWQAIKHATGMGSGECFRAAHAGDIEAVAALVWTQRKRSERKLNFTDVLGQITYRDLDFPDADSDEDADEAATPPSSDSAAE